MLKLNLKLLESCPQVLAGELPAAELDLPEAGEDCFGPVRYDLVATRLVGGVLVRGSLKTQVHGACGRCLVEFDLALAVPEVCHWYEKPRGEDLDLAPNLREDLLIGMPVKRLCRVDCLGLCPGCGNDRNQQPCHCAPAGIQQDVWSGLDSLPKV